MQNKNKLDEEKLKKYSKDKRGENKRKAEEMLRESYKQANELSSIRDFLDLVLQRKSKTLIITRQSVL